MMPPNYNLEDFARTFSQGIRAIIHILIWVTIGFASIAATYVAARTVWVAVKTILQALGI